MQVSTGQLSSTQHILASLKAPDPPAHALLHFEAQAHRDQSVA